MKKYIVLLFIFLSASQLIQAQTKATQEVSPQVKKELAILQKADLNLSDFQIPRITAILSSQEQIANKNLKAVEGNKSVMEQRMKELKANKINNLKGALTDQQIEKFNALKLEDKL